ncbi:hypothetical protein [Tautonia sociabilis]|uniref:Uncharacterized protein n=1 Tax=Tautonia sociabilis TaxID=2080755 RepID=A0A432MHE3_9BACT|nr:hypothetical protein [Tautonia sociabilis]RUL86720.1 hypothetical protein TsocGM_15545 [Tautonia sociabilis]
MPSQTSPPIDRHASAPEAQRLRFGVSLIILILTVPFLFDGAKLCYARWAALSGPVPIIQTPALDLAVRYIDEVSSVARRRAAKPFGRVPVPIEWAVGALITSLCIGTLIMRHNRLR